MTGLAFVIRLKTDLPPQNLPSAQASRSRRAESMDCRTQGSRVGRRGQQCRHICAAQRAMEHPRQAEHGWAAASVDFEGVAVCRRRCAIPLDVKIEQCSVLPGC